MVHIRYHILNWCKLEIEWMIYTNNDTHQKKYNWLFVKCYLTDNIDAIFDLCVVYHSSAELSIITQSSSPDVFNMIVQKYATKNDKNVALDDYHFVLFVIK